MNRRLALPSMAKRRSHLLARLQREGKPWPLCEDWPQCMCGKSWRHFQDADLDGLSPEQLDRIEEAAFFMFRCLAEICPDPAFARKAKEELKKPIWHRQYRLLVEEMEQWERRRWH
jgi:hypothetical protein